MSPDNFAAPMIRPMRPAQLPQWIADTIGWCHAARTGGREPDQAGVIADVEALMRLVVVDRGSGLADPTEAIEATMLFCSRLMDPALELGALMIERPSHKYRLRATAAPSEQAVGELVDRFLGSAGSSATPPPPPQENQP